MTDVISYRPRLPPHVRDDLLDGGPGIYEWRDRSFEVTRDGRKLSVIEIEPYNAPATYSDRTKSRPPQKHGLLVNIAVCGGIIAGSLAMLGAAVTHGSAANTLLLTAIASYVGAGVTYVVNKES